MFFLWILLLYLMILLIVATSLFFLRKPQTNENWKNAESNDNLPKHLSSRPQVFCHRCSKKFREIHRKTYVPEPVVSCEFCEVFKNIYKRLVLSMVMFNLLSFPSVFYKCISSHAIRTCLHQIWRTISFWGGILLQSILITFAMSLTL